VPVTWKEEGVTYYELMATVAHVKPDKGAGNIVSHVKVSEVYHQRKEKVTCTQWYLFNDLILEPIEKVSQLYWQRHRVEVSCMEYYFLTLY
jgi:PAB-dependent poly(A)-specific ribonuclease subunit 2